VFDTEKHSTHTGFGSATAAQGRVTASPGLKATSREDCWLIAGGRVTKYR